MKKLISAVLLVALVVVVAGCGPSAEQIMKNSMQSSKQIKTAHFNMKSTTKLPRAPISEGKVEKQNYVQAAEGDYDFRTGDFRVKTDLAGSPIVMLQVGDKQYWQIAGNWYEVPKSVQIAPPISSTLSVSQYIKYFKDLKKLGDTKIDKEGVYHVQAVPDMKEFVKQPGISDLLKDPTGKQIRTVDELEEIKAVFDFFVQKKDSYFKRSQATVESRAPNELIQLGYAQPGDKIKQDAIVTFSDFNEKLDFQAPDKVAPLPTKPEGE